MPLTYAFLITSSPDNIEKHRLAIELISAIKHRGHRVKSVFFYGDAVYAADSFRKPPSDEYNVANGWLELDLPLKACIATASKRGIHGTLEARQFKLDGENLLDGFDIVGLGDWIMNAKSANRVIKL